MRCIESSQRFLIVIAQIEAKLYEEVQVSCIYVVFLIIVLANVNRNAECITFSQNILMCFIFAILNLLRNLTVVFDLVSHVPCKKFQEFLLLLGSGII